MRPRRAGFTLFEVLAAVAVLGILYTVLAGVAMDGLRHEGESERRMRASLLADRVLAELEQTFANGSAPPLGRSENARDEFRVEVDVRPFDLSGYLATLPNAAAPDPKVPLPVLLTPPAQGGSPPLVEIELVVSWVEGAHEQAVRRLTFGFDVSAGAASLETLVPADDAPQAAERS